jgi:O-antigen polysaccharide polymerase Wzy
MLNHTISPVHHAFAPVAGADGEPNTGRRWLLGAALFLLLAGTLLLYSPMVEDSTYWPAIGLSTAILSLCMIALLRALGFAWQSAPIAYLAFVWMFHFPMTLFVHLIPGLQAELPDPLNGWIQHSDWYRASIYAFLCVTAFAFGSGLVAPARKSRDNSNDNPNDGPSAPPQDFDADKLKFQVGLFTAVGGLVWLYYGLIREGGLDLFGNSYAQMYNSVFGADFSIAIFVVSVGCFLTLLSAPRSLIWLPLVLQAAGSLPVLLIGARQFALIGPLVLAVLTAKRGLRLGLLRTATACVVALFIISYVGETRSHGVTEGVLGTRAVGPINALVEMGASLQTASLTFDWIQNGDRYLWGGSYWLPLERGLGLVLPIRTDLATDPRAMHMVMMSRTSGLGGSAVAESYYNFSAFGALFFLLLGYLLARLELNARSAVSAAFMGVVLYAFLFQARNWFINVPTLVFLGSLPVLACIFLEFIIRKREAGAAAHLDHRPAGIRTLPQAHWRHGRPE